MDGCLFLIGYGLWWLIKGVFKVIWLIVSCPFRIAEKYRDHKERERRLEEAKRLRQKQEESLSKEEETVENLFQKVKKDLVEIQLTRQDPKKIVIYNTYVELFYENGEYRKIEFLTEYGIMLETYSYFYYSDGTGTNDKVNQKKLLAHKINELFNNSYRINDVMKDNVSTYSDGLTMHYFVQQFVEMI